MTTVEKIVAMYDKERPFKIEAFWDSGIEFFEGNRISGFKHIDTAYPVATESFDSIVDKMWRDAGSPLLNKNPCSTCGGKREVKDYEYVDGRAVAEVAIPCPTCVTKGEKE